MNKRFGEPDALALGYESARMLPNGEIAAVMRMLFTAGLFVGVDSYAWRTRFCYETLQEAEDALAVWDGSGDPPGKWIKEKPSDRLGPGALK